MDVWTPRARILVPRPIGRRRSWTRAPQGRARARDRAGRSAATGVFTAQRSRFVEGCQRASRRLLAERQIALLFERGRHISPALLAVAGTRERGAPQVDELVEGLSGGRQIPVLQHDVAEPFEHDRQVAGVVEAARIAVVDPRQEIARALEFRQRFGPASRHRIEHVAMARDGLREAPLCAVVVGRRGRLGLEHGDGRRLIRERLLGLLALEQEFGSIGQRGRPLGRRLRRARPKVRVECRQRRRLSLCAMARSPASYARSPSSDQNRRRNPAGPPAPPARAPVRAARRSRDRSPCYRRARAPAPRRRPVALRSGPARPAVSPARSTDARAGAGPARPRGPRRLHGRAPAAPRDRPPRHTDRRRAATGGRAAVPPSARRYPTRR